MFSETASASTKLVITNTTNKPIMQKKNITCMKAAKTFAFILLEPTNRTQTKKSRTFPGLDTFCSYKLIDCCNTEAIKVSLSSLSHRGKLTNLTDALQWSAILFGSYIMESLFDSKECKIGTSWTGGAFSTCTQNLIWLIFELAARAPVPSRQASKSLYTGEWITQFKHWTQNWTLNYEH